MSICFKTACTGTLLTLILYYYSVREILLDKAEGGGSLPSCRHKISPSVGQMSNTRYITIDDTAVIRKSNR